MFELDSYYITFVSGIVIVIQALTMLAAHVPEESQMHKFRKSRLMLACAYFILAIPGILEFHLDKAHLDAETQKSMILMIASFESMLFTLALITLLQPNYLTYRNVFKHLLLPLLIISNLFPTFLRYDSAITEGTFYFAVALYFLQLCYYTLLFRRKYKICLEQMDDYYAEEEERRFLWIKQVFYLSLSIGVISLLSPFFSHFIYDVFVIVYTSFYIYLAIKINNYATLFQQVYPAISTPAPVVEEKPILPIQDLDQHLEESLKDWVAQKKYTEAGISLDDIAVSMGTNRSYLSRHFNTHMGISFKTWRTQLRIEEAQRLLIEQPELSLAEVGTLVGIHDRTNFHHRFQNVTGVTPTEWRNKHTAGR